MGKTDFLENELLDHVLRNEAYTAPSTIYVALFTTATDDTGAGTEVSGGSYARQSMAFDVASGGSTANSAEVAFPEATADWGTITHFALFDASTAGNMLYHAALTTSKQVLTGQIAKFQAGQLTVTED